MQMPTFKLYFKALKFTQSRYKNMYLADQKQKKTTEEGVHSALVQDRKQWVNYLE